MLRYLRMLFHSPCKNIFDKLLDIFLLILTVFIAPYFWFYLLLTSPSTIPPFIRILHKVYRKIMPKSFLIEYRGCTFLARRGEIDMMILRDVSEPWGLKYFNPNMGDVVLDVGAHVGKYTIPSAKQVGEKGLVIAIEPDQYNFNALKNNIALNNVSNITALNVAAYDKNQRMFLQGWTLNDIGAGIPVKAVKIDNTLENLNIKNIDWIKIDVEGSALPVLKGLCKTLSKKTPLKILIEVVYQEENKVRNFLKKYNFRGKCIDRTHGINEFIFERTYECI